jgi:hypothetical protein
MISAGRKTVLSGGCQCGKVRYALYTEPLRSSICHCRMCQKAFGSFFAPLCVVKVADFAWTRGEPGVFRSSALVERGFCRDCGTPLSVRDIDGDEMDLSIGSLDEPARARPTEQFGIESRLEWFAELHRLPGMTTEEDIPAERMADLRSLQHPDRAT